MTYRIGRDAVDGDVWLHDPSIVLSSGPSHSRDAGDTEPPYQPPRIALGFTAPRTEHDPLLWEGDQA